MAAKLEPTSYPGIYSRGSRYAVIYRDELGRQRQEAARTLDDARRLKARRETQVADGELSAARTPLHDYALEWIERYQGTGRRGFRDETRDEYRALLKKYALAYFPASTQIGKVTPRHVADFIGWLVKQPNRSGGTLSDSSVRNAFKPLAACLATARREGLIRHNPAADVALPHRPQITDDDEDRRPFTRDQLAAFLAIVHPRHRLLFDFAARTGLRASEILGLEGRHLKLEGERPHVKVRQRWRSGRMGPIKTRYARRDVPLAPDLVRALRALRVAPTAPVFTSQTGGRLDRDNMLRRVVKPAAEEAGAPFAGWHTFRHTCASILFAEGRNAVQVQRWLGHHSPSFTLDTYVHLLDDDLGAPLAALAETRRAARLSEPGHAPSRPRLLGQL